MRRSRELLAIQTYIPLFTERFRRAIVRRFPFAMFYEVIANEIQVLPFSIRDAILKDGSHEPASAMVNHEQTQLLRNHRWRRDLPHADYCVWSRLGTTAR
jgi:hypothetical protein